MSFTEDITKELDRIHANHQLRKITSRMAKEIDNVKFQQAEIKERLLIIEEREEKPLG